VIYDIVHRTAYRFHKPVSFGRHRLLFRPRDGHDMRVLATDLQVEPAAQRVDLLHDVYGNSIADVEPGGPADSLVITTLFTVDHLGSGSFGLPTAAESSWMPPAYNRAEVLALQPFLIPSYADPGHVLRAWAQPFANAGLGPMPGQRQGQMQVQNGAAAGPRETIAAMTQAIRDGFEYRARDEEGVQTPQQTLQLRSGSCRDFATLMIDALRLLGIAARFVSGYLYVPPLAGSSGNVGGGATHAWVQCYLSDCGWFPADPTNNLIGGHDLIRVAVGREAAEVVPLAGAWFGEKADFAGLTVDVSVTVRP
jgi:transglutaminase-like putative cysteine protease